MEIELSVLHEGRTAASAKGMGPVCLCYEQAYEPGDVLQLSCSEPGFLIAQLEDSLTPALVWSSGETFSFPIPFAEQRVCYSQKCFTGTRHLLFARAATAQEIGARRNLAFNPLDHHGNNALFPHALANVETRGEAWFAARNAIDGNVASAGHGSYPYESWGINRRADAELTVFFGRPVRVDGLTVTLRADFPHDNWWQNARFSFSDGSSETLSFVKSGLPQAFDIAPRTITSVTLCDMHKDESDPSPFPALTQLEVWGREAAEQ